MANDRNADFKQTLWKTADSLRAQMDAAEYKHLVLGPVSYTHLTLPTKA